MNVVYEPRGRAREYSELACNLGQSRGCSSKYKLALKLFEILEYYLIKKRDFGRALLQSNSTCEVMKESALIN